MTIDREELERLHKAATPGPWYIESDPYNAPFPAICEAGSPFEIASFTMGEDENENQANADIVTHLRNAVPDILALLDENDDLKRDVDRQMAIANSEANLAEELRAENAALVARVERLEEVLRQLRGNGDASGTWTEDAVRFPQMLSTRAKTMGMKMQQIEPVAWMYDNTFERCTYPIRKNHTLTPEDGWAEIPLYAQPQPSLVPGQSVDLVEVVDAEAARTFISEWPHHSFADFIEPALAEAFARHRRAAIAAMDNAEAKI